MNIAKKKKVKKFAYGGNVNNGNYANYGSPAPGVGLQYVASDPIAPNVNAALYYDKARRESEDFLQRERDKQTPDEQAIKDIIMKQPGTAGKKTELYNEAMKAIRGYKEKISADPNWVFTPEGKNSFSSISDIINPGRFQQLNDEAVNLNIHKDAATKNNTMNNIQITNGKVHVKNKDGKTILISLDELSANPKDYTPITVHDSLAGADNADSLNPNDDGLSYNGLQFNVDEAKKELSSYFSSVTGMIGSANSDSEYQSNKLALDAATNAAKKGLSQQSRDAYMEVYLNQARSKNENPTQAGFEKYLNDQITSERNTKLRVDSVEKTVAPTVNQNQNGQEVDSSGNNMPRKVDGFALNPVKRDDFISGGRAINFVSTASSDVSFETPDVVSIGSNPYKFSDEKGYTNVEHQITPNGKYSGNVYGSVQFKIVPEHTGDVYYLKNGSLTKVSDNDIKKGMLVVPEFQGEAIRDNPVLHRDGLSPNDPGFDYVILENGDENGQKIAKVNQYARKVVQEYDAKEEKFTGNTFMSDLDYSDSFRYFGGDYARIKDMSRVGVNANKITDAGRTFLRAQIDPYLQNANALFRAANQTRNAKDVAAYNQARQAYDIMVELSNLTEVRPLEATPNDEMYRAFYNEYVRGLQQKMDTDTYNHVKSMTNLPKPSGSTTPQASRAYRGPGN